MGVNKLANSTISGGTDGTTIGNISDKLKTASTIYGSGGTEAGTSSNPFIVSTGLDSISELQSGKLFGAAASISISTSSTDNPILLFRNPLVSGKTCTLRKITAGISIVNVECIFKIFGSPTLSTTVTNITTISQPGLSTTVTVTTSAPNNATIGATITVAGTTNFNGAWTVLSVTSATVFTFTKTPAPLITTTENTGTVTVESSLGTTLSPFPLKRVTSPVGSIALLTTTPTVPADGSLLFIMSQGQNNSPGIIIDSPQLSLAPGQDMLITGNTSSNNRNSTLSLIWSED